MQFCKLRVNEEQVCKLRVDADCHATKKGSDVCTSCWKKATDAQRERLKAVGSHSFCLTERCWQVVSRNGMTCDMCVRGHREHLTAPKSRTRSRSRGRSPTRRSSPPPTPRPYPPMTRWSSPSETRRRDHDQDEVCGALVQWTRALTTKLEEICTFPTILKDELKKRSLTR